MSPADLKRRDLRRLARDLWPDPRCDAVAPAVLDAVVAADAKSCDRAVITGYLHHFPTDHPQFERLARTSGLVANRRDWPWRDRGVRWRLWDRDAGPSTLARALLDGDDPAALLRDAGLDGDLAEGEFVADALDAACEQAATARGDEAAVLGERLIALFAKLSARGADIGLIDGLLRPWVRAQPADAHKRRLAAFLTARFGDPRIDQTRWAAICDGLAERGGSAEPEALIDVLRRWLTEAAVRAFFSIVGRTAERKDQWAAREKFWLGYLDAGVVRDGWFAFGRQAERLAGALAREEALQFGRVVGGADPSHSSLILSIGDLRIAEWSHNGSCRFWRADQRQAPVPYRRSYDGTVLRTTHGSPGFSYIPHQGAWESKFARQIYGATGVRHPVYGQG